MSPKPDNYDCGKLDERVEVAIQTIRKVEQKVDRLAKLLAKRPCAVHGAQIRIQWVLLTGVFAGFGGLFWYTIQRLSHP